MRLGEQRGFTLIEVLVVCIVVGVLAAIALPAFLSQTEKAEDASIKSHLNTAGHVVESRSAQHDTYASTVADLIAAEPSLADAQNLSVTTTSRTYRIEADSESGIHYVLARLASGAMLRDCAPRGSGGCSATDDGDGNHW